MGVLDAIGNVARAAAVGGANLPPGAPAPGGHASAFDAIGAAIKAQQPAGQAPQEAPRTLFNIIDTSAINAIRNGSQQAPTQPQEDQDGMSKEQQAAFVKDVYPHAVDAAKQIGVDPSVLVAQAGLETGWGTKFPKNADGSSSYNYFSIKPGSNYAGPTTVPTTTHEQNASGEAHTESDAFRSYKSPQESFSDYVAFLKANPRYKNVLANAKGQDATSYATALQKAGYATDTQYGSKVGATARTVASLAQ